MRLSKFSTGPSCLKAGCWSALTGVSVTVTYPATGKGAATPALETKATALGAVNAVMGAVTVSERTAPERETEANAVTAKEADTDEACKLTRNTTTQKEQYYDLGNWNCGCTATVDLPRGRSARSQDRAYQGQGARVQTTGST
jgi:hypothetical protein